MDCERRRGTPNLRWVVHERGTPREHRDLQQEYEVIFTNRVGVATAIKHIWVDVEEVDSEECTL